MLSENRNHKAQNQAGKRRHLPASAKKMPPLLLAASLLLAACAPEEKTLLLATESASEEETESVDSSRDFTVKKIYTYTYQTRSELGQSAFLQDCGENEIHIMALGDSDSEDTLSLLQVDYRYGFYDVLGEFFQSWENWSNPSGGEMKGDLYIDRLLPSPDGRQLLVYVKSAFWERLTVYLYTLGAQEPLLLYDGTSEINGPLKGSFSPSGRWVTFDVLGSSTCPVHLVPVYDCRKDREGEEKAAWTIPPYSSLLTPPDQALHADAISPETPCNAVLCDDDGKAGWIAVTVESGTTAAATKITLPETDIVLDASLLEASPYYCYASFYLDASEGMPFPQYKISADGDRLDYMGNPLRFCHTRFSTGGPSPLDQEIQAIRDFPEFIWDFLHLDSGDLLVALVQEAGQESLQNTASLGLAKTGINASTGEPEQENDTYLDAWKDYCPTIALQSLWEIQSADLYLYPEGSENGQLLYKNLQNLIHMEYDPVNGRILLETYESDDFSHRKCIILQL